MENKKKFCPVMYTLYSTEHVINILVRKQKGSRLSQVNSRKFPEFQVYGFVCLKSPYPGLIKRLQIRAQLIETWRVGRSQSIEWFLEDKAFLLSYDLDPPFYPVPLPRQQVSLSPSVSDPPVELTVARGAEGGRNGAKSYDCEKAWSSINHSILSGLDVRVGL